MASFNKVILAGNLTRDPELRYTPKGTPVAQASIAINRKWRDEAGEQKEEVTFVEFDCFGKTAENLTQYMKKGGAILIEGRLKLDQWDDKQTGQKRQKIKVIAETIQFLGSAGGDGQSEQSGGQSYRDTGWRPRPIPPRGDAPKTAGFPAGGFGQPQEPAPPDDDDVPF